MDEAIVMIEGTPWESIWRRESCRLKRSFCFAHTGHHYRADPAGAGFPNDEGHHGGEGPLGETGKTA